MREILALCTVLGAVLARPNVSGTADITRYDFNLNGIGNYTFVVDTTDGFHHDAKGEVKNIGDKDEELVVTGTYSYNGSNGFKYSVDYVADTNGYRPIVKQHLSSIARNLPLTQNLPLTSSTTTSKTLNISTVLTPSTTLSPENETLPPLSLGELCITCRIPGNDRQK